MKTITILLFAIFYNLQSYSQIDGLILSEQNHKPVQYATILILKDSISGITTDSSGYFNLQISEKTYLYVSAVGFKDTIIQAGSFKCKNLYLKTKVYNLDEVVVTPSLQKPIIIGLPDAQPNDDGWLYVYPGQLNGIFYKTHRKEVGKNITSIQIYIGSQGIPSTPMGIRIMTYDKAKLSKNIAIPTDNFYDLLPKLLTFIPEKAGWQNIDLTLYDVKMPTNGILVLFYPIKTDKKYQWTDKNNKKYYGAIIANSNPSFKAYKFACLQPNERKIYILSNQMVSNYTPMVTIKLN